jgi:hypothetical protein
MVMLWVTLLLTSISNIKEVRGHMSDYLNRIGNPAPAVNRANVGAPIPQPLTGKAKKLNLKGKGFKLFSGLLLACITVLLVALVAYLFISGNGAADLSQVKANQYQAVFLNSADGQVYFGRLTQLNKDYYKLTDIYYVRVTTVQPDDGSTDTQQSISLAKLGSEIHGPEDAMYISKDNVMFWENLKEDGQWHSRYPNPNCYADRYSVISLSSRQIKPFVKRRRVYCFR